MFGIRKAPQPEPTPGKGKATPKQVKVQHKLTRTDDGNFMAACGVIVASDARGQRLCRRCYGL